MFGSAYCWELGDVGAVFSRRGCMAFSRRCSAYNRKDKVSVPAILRESSWLLLCIMLAVQDKTERGVLACFTFTTIQTPETKRTAHSLRLVKAPKALFQLHIFTPQIMDNLYLGLATENVRVSPRSANALVD